MKKKPMDNIEIVKNLMSYSKYGALSQMFIIDAITKHAKSVSEMDPKEFESSMVFGPSWIGVAKEIKDRLDAAYDPRKV